MLRLSPVGLAAAPVANQVSLLATFREKLCRSFCIDSSVQPLATVEYSTGTPILNGTTVFVPVTARVTVVTQGCGCNAKTQLFTEALAEHLSKMMENASGQAHTWTASQVKKAMESFGLMPFGKTKTEATLGDVTYLANMYYTDLYPDPFKDEASCLRAAYRIAVDPDGYKGMIFCRWTADAIGKALSIDWEKFV